jgi:putative transposase
MTKKHRHSAAEIATKLEEADVLLAEGRSQTELARALGISVMTFHRWRKARPRMRSSVTAVSASGQTVANLTDSHGFGRFAALQIENARLRKLVTDRLLEKMKLEEEGMPTRAGINKASG